MKTLITFFVSLAALLVSAIFTSGQMPDVALVFASLFSASLATWTVQQYDRKFLPLTRTRPLRLLLDIDRSDNAPDSRRLAA